MAANEIVHFASHALFACIPALGGGGGGDAWLLRGGAAGAGAGGAGGAGGGGAAGGAAGGGAGGGAASGAEDSSWPPAEAAGANESGETRPQTGLIPRFTPFSLSFYALLPFAGTPSPVMSQMHSTPYVDAGTVLLAAPQLLAGLAGRLRAGDLAVRHRLGLPLFCPDLGRAAALGPAAGGLCVLRDHELETPARAGVHVAGYAAGAAAGYAARAAAGAAGAGAAAGAAAGATSGGEPPAEGRHEGPPPAPRPGLSRAAARAAAARGEEERRARRAAVSASAHCVHALSVLLQVRGAGVRGCGDAPEQQTRARALHRAQLAHPQR